MNITQSTKYDATIIDFAIDVIYKGKLLIFGREKYIVWYSDKTPDIDEDIIISQIEKMYR